MHSLLLSQSQTQEHSLGDLLGACVIVDFVKERRVELPLRVQRGRGLPDLSTDGPFVLSSFVRKRSLRCRDQAQLIRW